MNTEAISNYKSSTQTISSPLSPPTPLSSPSTTGPSYRSSMRRMKAEMSPLPQILPEVDPAFQSQLSVIDQQISDCRKKDLTKYWNQEKLIYALLKKAELLEKGPSPTDAIPVYEEIGTLAAALSNDVFNTSDTTQTTVIDNSTPITYIDKTIYDLNERSTKLIAALALEKSEKTNDQAILQYKTLIHNFEDSYQENIADFFNKVKAQNASQPTQGEALLYFFLMHVYSVPPLLESSLASLKCNDSESFKALLSDLMAPLKLVVKEKKLHPNAPSILDNLNKVGTPPESMCDVLIDNNPVWLTEYFVKYAEYVQSFINVSQTLGVTETPDIADMKTLLSQFTSTNPPSEAQNKLEQNLLSFYTSSSDTPISEVMNRLQKVLPKNFIK